MATVDKDAIREWKRDADDSADNRAKRLDEYADGAAEANANLESPPGATGPGWVPPAGGDPDTATRSAKVQEAVDDVVLAANRRSSGRDDWERATNVRPARKAAASSTSDSDPDNTGERTGMKPAETDAERVEREKREAAEKRADDKPGTAETVAGRRSATKSTT